MACDPEEKINILLLFLIAPGQQDINDDMYLTDFKPDIAETKSLVLAIPDNRFWSFDNCIGKTRDAGKKHRNSPKVDT